MSATRRAVAAYLGAALCVLWAILTAWAYLRHPEPEPEEDGVQPADPWTTALSRTMTSAEMGGQWTISVGPGWRDGEALN